MKKFLPKSANNPQGFTLIELMVVISIIAILAIIGMVAYSTIQKRARDTRRRAEITAIAYALEANYNDSTAKYALLATTQFTDGAIPVDIYSGTNKCGTAGARWCEYCSRDVAGTAMTKGQNPAGGCTTGGAKVSATKPPVDTAFEVCATLETSPYFYCKISVR